MSYRPITGEWECPPIDDTWFLARSKVKYYGAYPAGFLERARAFLGVSIIDPVLHVCGGRVREYPFPKYALGPLDKTLDLDPALAPDFLQDARDPWPQYLETVTRFMPDGSVREEMIEGWPAIMIDPPYTGPDAEHYEPGIDVLPSPDVLLARGLEAVRMGGRIGILHYLDPKPPEGVRYVASIAVRVGFRNRVRSFSVFEKGLE